MKKATITISILVLLSYIFSSISVSAAEINKFGSAGAVPNDNQIDAIDSEQEKKLPEKYSSKDLGYTTSVKNQEDDEICWIYGSLASYESLLLKNNLFNGDLSVKHLNEWATPRADGTGWQRELGSAGWTDIACGYFASWNGAVREGQNTPENVISEIVFLGKEDKELIKTMIMKNGAVTANLNIDYEAFSSDKNSYCRNEETDVFYGHTVSVVGWDDNYAKENFDGKYKPKNNGAWLCKNSWGEDENSNGGYLWISYEDYYLFDNKMFAPSYSIKNVMPLSDKGKLYQNEEYGATFEFNYIDNSKVTYLNVFDFDNQNMLKKVMFETLCLGADYTVYYVPIKDEIPNTNKKTWCKLGEGTVTNTGYICIDCNKIVQQNTGAIAVEMNSENTDRKNSIGVDEWLTNFEDDYEFIDNCLPGKGFVMYDNKIEDVKKIYMDRDDYVGGNLVIKAYADDTYPILSGDTNCDGEVDVLDATAIQKYVSKMRELDEYSILNGDYNKDNVINILDCTLIQKKIAKII